MDGGRPGALGRGEEVEHALVEAYDAVPSGCKLRELVVGRVFRGKTEWNEEKSEEVPDHGGRRVMLSWEVEHSGTTFKVRGQLGTISMSHALLLRLFLSPSFFSVHVALRYLMLYADNIGITYYLTRRLADLGTHELRDVWGFIWCVQRSDSFVPNLMHGHRV